MGHHSHQVLTAVEDTGVEGSCVVPPKRFSIRNCTKQPEVNTFTQTDCPESLIHSKLLCNKHMNTNSVMTLRASF